jgi:uncharacterized lipoprotein YajG
MPGEQATMDTTHTRPAPTAAAVAARQVNLLKAYGLTSTGPSPAQELAAAHARAQSLRFAASPSFAATLQEAVDQFRATRGAA